MEIIIKTKQKFNPFFSFLNYDDPLFPYYKHLKEVILTGGYRPVPRLDSGNGVGGEDSFGLVGQTEARDSWMKSSRVSPFRGTTNLRTPIRSSNGSNSTTDSKSMVKKESSEAAESESDSDDSDGGYLHPLLMKASLKASKPPPTTKATPPTTTESSPTPTSTSWVALGSSTATSAASKVDKKLSMEELLSLHNSSSFTARSMAVNSAPVLSSSGLASRGEVTSQETVSDTETLAAYEHYKQQYYGRYGQSRGLCAL